MLRALALLAALAAPLAQGAPSLGEETLPPGVSMALAQLAPQRPGVIDLYALVVAGDGTEDVFKREAEAVREVLDERLGARGRSLALVNHRSAARPQATLKSIELALNAIRCLKMQEEMIYNGDCVGTASGAVFCSEHNLLASAVWSVDPTTASMFSTGNRPTTWVFSFLNWLSWIMLSAPSCFLTVKLGFRTPCTVR
jgi:hypothetical protein